MDTRTAKLKSHFKRALLKERQYFRKICRNNENCFKDADPNKELSFLEAFVSNPGFYGVANSILSQLDYKSLANCRMTSKCLKKFIDKQDFWMLSQIEMMAKIDGEWNSCLDYVYLNAKGETLRHLTFLSKEVKMKNEQHLLDQLTFYDYFISNGQTDLIMDVGNALIYACEKGNVPLVSLILYYARKNPHIIIPNNDNEDSIGTPFHSACKDGGLKVVKLLIDYGIELGLDVNVRWLDHHPIHSAIIHDQYEVVKYLLENRTKIGLDLNVTNVEGLTPLILAYRGNYQKIVKLFEKHGYELPNFRNEALKAFYDACFIGDIHAVMKLLEKRMEIGLEINAIADDALGTPLHAACFNGHDEVVWHLLAYRIELELDVDFYNGEDETPYQVAKARNHINVVKAFDFYRLSNED